MIHSVEELHRESTRHLLGRHPHRNSSFLRTIGAPASDPNTSTHPIISTLFSGGTFRCSHQTYHTALTEKRNDILKGVLFADNEYVHNRHGFRCFFELDYRHPTQLPSKDEVRQHVREAHNLLRDCYPSGDVTCHVCSCTPKIKQKADKPVLSFGIHLIFEHILLTTTEQKLLNHALNARIRHLSTTWEDIVDSGAVHTSTTSLRPIFSHKLQACYCIPDKKECRITTEKFTPCEACVRGRLLHPSVYVHTYTMNNSGELVHTRDTTLLTSIVCTSIVSPRPFTFTPGFSPTHEMTDHRSEGGLYVPAAPEQVGQVQGTADGLTSILEVILHRVSPKYVQCTVSQYRVHNDRTFIYFSARGYGEKYCFLQAREHSSNHASFTLCLYSRHLILGCHNKECTRIRRSVMGKHASRKPANMSRQIKRKIRRKVHPEEIKSILDELVRVYAPVNHTATTSAGPAWNALQRTQRNGLDAYLVARQSRLAVHGTC